MGEPGLSAAENVFDKIPMISDKSIPSAYCKSRREADVDIKQELHSMAHGGDRVDSSSSSSSQSSLSDMSCQPALANGNSIVWKMKHPPAAVGAVSNFLGKDYIRSQPSSRTPPEASKPLKLDSDLMPMSALWIDEDKVQVKDDQLHKEMEDFLFKMLGEGFQLNRDLIRDVLGKCGYDMQKSMEKLFSHSAAEMEKKSFIHQETTPQCKDPHSRAGGLAQHKKIQHTGSRRLKVSAMAEDKHNLQKEVLAALFTSERREDSPSTIAEEKSEMCIAKRSSQEEIVESPKKLTSVDSSNSMESKEDNHENDEEDSYEVLRKAVLEHRRTMKEYYKAATEAFQQGDQVRANKLLEKGRILQHKAREADDESAKQIFETSENEDTEDSISLNLFELESREAIRLLKHHITSLAGNMGFKYLKLIIETADGDASKGARRRRIMRFLEKESIKWTEDGTAGTMLIPLEGINRRSLSFGHK